MGGRKTNVMKTFLRRVHSARHFAQSASILTSSSAEMSGAPERRGTSLSVSCAIFVGTKVGHIGSLKTGESRLLTSFFVLAIWASSSSSVGQFLSFDSSFAVEIIHEGIGSAFVQRLPAVIALTSTASTLLLSSTVLHSTSSSVSLSAGTVSMLA